MLQPYSIWSTHFDIYTLTSMYTRWCQSNEIRCFSLSRSRPMVKHLNDESCCWKRALTYCQTFPTLVVLTPTRMNGDTVVCVYPSTIFKVQWSLPDGNSLLPLKTCQSSRVLPRPYGNSGPGCERLSLEQEICRKLLYEQERIFSEVQIRKIGVSQRKWKWCLGKDAILANLWIDFCDPLFKTGKNNAEIDSFFFPGNLSSTIE